MSANPIESVAQALVHARQTYTCADAQRLADALGTPDDAYAVQDAVAALLGWRASGANCWKSGGPSRQAQPTHAELPRAGVWPSPADGRNWPFTWRGIEAEIALRMGRLSMPDGPQPWMPPAPPRWWMRWRCPSRWSIHAGSSMSMRRPC